MKALVCSSCGADLPYKPYARSVKCGYCGQVWCQELDDEGDRQAYDRISLNKAEQAQVELYQIDQPKKRPQKPVQGPSFYEREFILKNGDKGYEESKEDTNFKALKRESNAIAWILFGLVVVAMTILFLWT